MPILLLFIINHSAVGLKVGLGGANKMYSMSEWARQFEVAQGAEQLMVYTRPIHHFQRQQIGRIPLFCGCWRILEPLFFERLGPLEKGPLAKNVSDSLGGGRRLLTLPLEKNHFAEQQV